MIDIQCFIADDKPDNRFNDGKCDLVSASSFYNDYRYTLRQLGQKVLSGKFFVTVLSNSVSLKYSFSQQPVVTVIHLHVDVAHRNYLLLYVIL